MDILGGVKERVLATSEIQNRVFSFIDRSDNARCARVCLRWKDIALDNVWREMESLKPLLELLTPLEEIEKDSVVLTFSRIVRPSDWERLMPYARRVKKLLFSPTSDSSQAPGQLSEKVFLELARTRPVFRVFPNLRHVTIRDSKSSIDWIPHASLFLHGGVSSLTVVLPESAKELADLFFEELPVRCPKLTHFHVTLEFYDDNVQDSFTKLVPKLARLKVLEVSSCMLTPRLLLSLVTLKGLLEIGVHTCQGFRRRDKVRKFGDIRIEEGTFPRLATLTLQGDLHDFRLFFQRHESGIFEKLRRLNLCKAFSYSSGIWSLLRSLSVSSRRLRELTIRPDREEDAASRKRAADGEEHPLTYEDLIPLPRFSFLQIFRLHHSQPIDMSNEDLAIIFSQCRALKELVLNPKPFHLGNTSLTLSVLALLAEMGSMLQKVGLYIDATLGPVPLHHVTRAFNSLSSINLCLSPISNPTGVAAYLGQLLPETCTLESVYHDYETEEQRKRVAKWDEVGLILPALSHMLKDSRERVDALEIENTELRKSLSVRDKELQALLRAAEAQSQGIRYLRHQCGCNMGQAQ